MGKELELVGYISNGCPECCLAWTFQTIYRPANVGRLHHNLCGPEQQLPIADSVVQPAIILFHSFQKTDTFGHRSYIVRSQRVFGPLDSLQADFLVTSADRNLVHIGMLARMLQRCGGLGWQAHSVRLESSAPSVFDRV